MRTFLLRDARRIHCDVNDDGSACTVVGHACPVCKASPFRIVGDGKRPSDDDRAWECDAFCRDCKVSVGVCRVEVETMFGVREDVAVGLRARVYTA